MNSYRILRSYEFAHEAQLDLMKLHDEGIAAVLKNERMVSMAPHYSNAVGGVQLLVNDEDFDAAAKVLSYEADESALLQEMYPEAPLEPVTTCPKCGSTNLIQGRSAWSGLLSLLVFMLPLSIQTKNRYCAVCGHRWKEIPSIEADRPKDEQHSPKESIVDFFKTSPLVGSGIVIERSRDTRK
jgi:DNA-directed RNA polymerase subunit M/transcription elongation factor TFIIS